MTRSKTPFADTGLNRLLNKLRDDYNLKNDAALARYLGTPAPIISKWRHDLVPVSAHFIIVIHEKTGMSVAEVKSYLPAPVAVAVEAA